MPEQRSPLREFRHLEEKLTTVGLSPAEQARYRQLKEIVAPEPSAPRPGFDVNAAAEALKASLEPAGRARAAPAWDPGQAQDAGAAPWDPSAQGWPQDPGAQALDPNAQAWAQDPSGQAWDPNQPYDPAAQAWDPNQPVDPNAQAWDPNQPADPNAQAWPQDPSAQPWDPNQAYDPNAPYGYAAQPDASALDAAGAGLDPGSGALNQVPVDAGAEAAAWEPAASGSYDQAAWDVESPQPPLDPAVAYDANAPPFDATASGEAQAGSWDATGQAPVLQSGDLGPEAFDAAALPPVEPGPGSYDQAAWDAATAAAEPEAVPPPEGEPVEAQPVEAELVEAELVEAQPPPEAPAPDFDSYPLGPPAHEPGEGEPPGAGTFSEAEPPAAEGAGLLEEAPTGDQLAPAEGSVELAEAGGPGPREADVTADAVAAPSAEPAGTAAEAPPLASPNEFVSFEPPTSAAADALGGGEVAIEELPPVDMDVEEIAEAPEPEAPQARATVDGVPAPSFVAGEHRVVIHTLEGQVLRGTLANVDLDAAAIPLVAAAGAAAEPIEASKVKAIFFMLLPGGRAPAPEGRKVRVTFRDGRQVAGFSADYDPEAAGFFMVPADTRTNTGRIWVYRAAVRQVSVT